MLQAVIKSCPQIRFLVIDGKDGEGIVIEDPNETLRNRYDLHGGGVYLIRPDQHVCARWRSLDADRLAAAWRRACGHELTPE